MNTLSPREVIFLEASAEAILPSGGVMPSALDAQVVPYLERLLARLPRRQRVLIRLLFVFIEHGSLLFGPVRRRVTRQSIAQRRVTFGDWEGSDLYLRRVSFLSLRSLLTIAYFGDSRVNRLVEAR